MKEKYDTSNNIDKYMSLAQDVMFTKVSVKNGVKQSGEREVADMFKAYQQFNDDIIQR